MGAGYEKQEVEYILVVTMACCDIAVINTFFKKTEDQFMTYKSGRAESQIDE